MTTSVPAIQFTPTGLVVPTEAEILAGELADLNAAFGGNLNITNLATPQGQIAQSIAAIVGDKNNQILEVCNQVDPNLAEGLFQDAIGYIYFLTRIPATATTLTVNCNGAAGVQIPVGATIADSAGNVYSCDTAVTIPASGSVQTTFSNTTLGPIAVPGTVTISQTIPQWDSVTLVSGVEGTAVETQQEFEYRRQQSVAANSVGMLNSVLGAVWGVAGVLDVYATENPQSTQAGAVITGSISGNLLTVANVVSGVVAIGQTVVGNGINQGCVINGGSAPRWTLNQTYASPVPATGTETITCAVGGVVLSANSIYIGVYGGNSNAIGQAIYSKRMPGSNYNGNTFVTVPDPGPASNPYANPLPLYIVQFQTLTVLPIAFAVTLRNNTAIPSNYAALIQAAIQAAFTGSDGGQRARSGILLLASRYVSGILALGSWAQLESIYIGPVPSDAIGTTRSTMQLQINQTPTFSASNLLITLSSI